MTQRRPPGLVAALAVVPVLVVAVFYLWPLVTLVTEVVDPGVIADTLGRDGLAEIVWFTTWQAVASTALTLLVGVPLCGLLSRWAFPGRRALAALVAVPFMLPTVVVGAAFVALLPDSLHGTAIAIVLAHAWFNVAVVVRVVGASWETIPTDLAAAAATLGAGPVQVVRLVVLPVLRPALVAATAVTFLFTFTSFGVVRVLGGPGTATLEVEVVRRATQLGDVGGAAVLAIGQLALLLGLVGWSALAQRRAVAHGGEVVRRRAVVTRRDRWIVGVGAAGATLVVATPLVVLAATSLRPGGMWSLETWRTLGGTEIRPGISLGVDPVASMLASVRTAIAATLLAVVIGTTTALAVDAAGRRGRWLDLGMMLPLGTSAVTIGLGMLITFDVAPFDWRDAVWLVPLGHALVAVPFVVRTLLPVLRARPTGWLDAAATLGASPLRAWWAVDVRILRRPAVVAAGLAAAISLGEFGATTFLSRTGEATLPLAIDRLLGRTGDLPRAQGFALATILMAVTGTIVVAVDALAGRRPDRRVHRAARR